MNTSQSMRGRYALATLLTATMAFGVCQTSLAQSEPVVEIVHVNIEREWPSIDPEDGESWTTAYRFLQDGLFRANQLLTPPTQIDEVEIWVAAGTYRPDQGSGYTLGQRDHSFQLRNNVRILGGFPTDPANHHGPGVPADINDRDWEANITVLSGDLNNDDAFCQRFDPTGPNYDPDCGLKSSPVDYLEFNNYDDNSFHVVSATVVSSTAVLDGFTVRGGIDICGAQPRFRDCVFVLHEGAAVRCVGGSEVMFHRCTFTGETCGAIVVDEGSRLALVACEPRANLGDAHRSGIARVSACSELIAVDAAQRGPESHRTHLAPGQ